MKEDINLYNEWPEGLKFYTNDTEYWSKKFNSAKHIFILITIAVAVGSALIGIGIGIILGG